MSGFQGNFFSTYEFPHVGISRRDLLYTVGYASTNTHTYSKESTDSDHLFTMKAKQTAENVQPISRQIHPDICDDDFAEIMKKKRRKDERR